MANTTINVIDTDTLANLQAAEPYSSDNYHQLVYASDDNTLHRILADGTVSDPINPPFEDLSVAIPLGDQSTRNTPAFSGDLNSLRTGQVYVIAAGSTNTPGITENGWVTTRYSSTDNALIQTYEAYTDSLITIFTRRALLGGISWTNWENLDNSAIPLGNRLARNTPGYSGDLDNVRTGQVYVDISASTNGPPTTKDGWLTAKKSNSATDNIFQIYELFEGTTPQIYARYGVIINGGSNVWTVWKLMGDDNLGNHTATQNINANNFNIINVQPAVSANQAVEYTQWKDSERINGTSSYTSVFGSGSQTYTPLPFGTYQDEYVFVDNGITDLTLGAASYTGQIIHLYISPNAGGDVINGSPLVVNAGPTGPSYYLNRGEAMTLRGLGSNWNLMTSQSQSSHILKAHKVSDQTIVNSSTLALDSRMQFGVARQSASQIGKYSFTLQLYYNAAATPGFKFGFSFPSGTTGFYMDDHDSNAAVTYSLSSSRGVTGTGTNVGSFITGYFEVTTPGIFGLTWSQNTINAAATTLKAGSHMTAIRLN